MAGMRKQAGVEVEGGERVALRRRSGGTAARRVKRAHRAALVAAFSLLAGFPLGCGDTTHGEDSPGSAGESAAQCEDGRTRACSAPSGCLGQQSCESGDWTECDCADGNGAGGVAGDDAGAGQGGASSAAQAGGAAGSSDGGAGSPDTQADPCDGVEARCEDAPCGQSQPPPATPVPRCEQLRGECVFTNKRVVLIDDTHAYPVFRLPRASRLADGCECANGTPIAARFELTMATDESGSEPTSGHFTVREPWHFSDLTCTGKVQCKAASGFLPLYTEDADAPEINVYYSPGECPKD